MWNNGTGYTNSNCFKIFKIRINKKRTILCWQLLTFENLFNKKDESKLTLNKIRCHLYTWMTSPRVGRRRFPEASSRTGWETNFKFIRTFKALSIHLGFLRIPGKRISGSFEFTKITQVADKSFLKIKEIFMRQTKSEVLLIEPMFSWHSCTTNSLDFLHLTFKVLISATEIYENLIYIIGLH